MNYSLVIIELEGHKAYIFIGFYSEITFDVCFGEEG